MSCHTSDFFRSQWSCSLLCHASWWQELSVSHSFVILHCCYQSNFLPQSKFLSSSLCISLVDASKHQIRILHCAHPQIEFPLVSLRWPQASSPLSDSTKAYVFLLFANVRQGREVGRILFNAVSRSARFPLTALGCPSLTRRWKRSTRTELLRSSASVEEKGNKCCFIRLCRNVAPLTVRRISSLRVMNSRRISRLTRARWGRQPDCCYQNSFPYTGKRNIKDGRRKEEQTSLLLTE